MSALPPEADTLIVGIDVRYVPVSGHAPRPLSSPREDRCFLTI